MKIALLIGGHKSGTPSAYAATFHVGLLMSDKLCLEVSLTLC